MNDIKDTEEVKVPERKFRRREANENSGYALALDINGTRLYFSESNCYVCGFSLVENVKDAQIFTKKEDCAWRRRKIYAQCHVLLEPTIVYLAFEDVGFSSMERIDTVWSIPSKPKTETDAETAPSEEEAKG